MFLGDCMLYLNVTKNNEFVMSEDKKYDRNSLITLTIKELEKSDVTNVSIAFRNKRFFLKFELDNQEYLFDMFLKNITGAGWEDKPEIKRCQVSNAKNDDIDIEIIEHKKYNLILGYYCFDENPILVAWDPYRYMNHNTIRSCYVTVDTLKRGYEKGFYEGVVSSQKLWVFKGECFVKFVNRYIEYISELYLKG